VDPGASPDPSQSSAWVTLTAVSVLETTPPSISDLRAVPDPVEIGQATTVQANITDSSGVASASITVKDPAGGDLGNHTMAHRNGNMYVYAVLTARVGSYGYVITAFDGAGNPAVATGAFRALDTTGPAITSVGATPDPVELGQSTTLGASVADLGGVASVHVQLRDPVGSVVGNFTMTSAGGDRYRYAFTPTVLGRYAFTVTAFDSAGNGKAAPGTFTFRDTTRPVANAGPDRTSPPHSGVVFDGSASSDNDRVANYTWTFDDGGPKTLYRVRPVYIFERAGVFDITLTVRDPSGNEGSDIVRVTVTSAVGMIRGTVKDDTGNPLVAATVRLISGSTEVARIATNASGGFVFQDVAPGSYTLEAGLAGFDAKTEPVSVMADLTASKDIVLTRTSAASGVPGWALPASVAAILVLLVAIAYAVRRRSRNRSRLPDENPRQEKP
jgi:hypothetical protein